MDGIRCPIVTFCSGSVSGPALAIAAHGLRGFRVAAPGVRFSFKEFDLQGPARKIAGYESLLALLAQTVASDTRRPLDEVQEWFRSGLQLTPQEALRLGLIDLISAQPILPKS
jgi:ATP-dependent protease ClpP protease subunit